jgi:hypothetical protein
MDTEKIRNIFYEIQASNESEFEDFASFESWFKSQPYVCSKCGKKNNDLELYSIKNVLFGNHQVIQRQNKDKTLKVDLFLRRIHPELPYTDTNLEFRCIYCVNELKD